MFRPVTITAVLNGWIVQCGCQTLAFQDRNQLVSELDAYLKDPEATEIRMLKSGVNAAHTYPAPVPTAPPTASAWTNAEREQYRARDGNPVGVGLGYEATRQQANQTMSGGAMPTPTRASSGVTLRD